MKDVCVYCGRAVPEGRQICWACEYKHSGLKPDCQWFHGSGYCLLKMGDCTPLPCRWYDKDPNYEKRSDI